MKRIKSKWESLDENVQKWASRLGAVATIVGIIAAGGSWLIAQIDNSLAAHIEGQTAQIEEQVTALSEKVDKRDKEIRLQVMRLELMALMENDPENTVEIEKLAHAYFQKGGNSYMSGMYASYCKQYGADCEIMFK